MRRYQTSHIFSVLVMAVILTTFLVSAVTLEEKNIPNAIVEFDPYVSTLDKANQFRYGIADLQFLIAKVATRFSQIYIELTLDDLKLDHPQYTSRFLSPLAAARYNNAVNTTQKVEVWLGLGDNIFDIISTIPKIMEHLYSIINSTNAAHEGTLSTLLISQKTVLGNNTKIIKDMKQVIQETNLRRGMLVEQLNFCDKKAVDLFEPNIIILRGNSYVQFGQQLEQQLDNCNVEIKTLNRTLLMGVVHHVPDTGTDNIVNTSKLVSSWNNAVKWANNSGNIVILSTAFDLPYKPEIANKTAGWWRLLENSSYRSAGDLIFEEKSLVAEQVDSEENPTNFQWLNKPIHFHAKTSGMFLQEDELSKADLKKSILKELIRSNITRILIIDKKYLKQGSTMTFCSIDAPSNVATIALLNRYSANSAEQNASQNLGLYFSRSTCDNYGEMETSMKRKLFNSLGDTRYTIFVFYYIEKEEIVKLGARRMFNQRIVKLDLCRKMILKSGNTRTQIGYVLLEYPDLSLAYQSPWALQNIVKYYTLLHDWATTQTNVTIFLPAIDRMKTGLNSPLLGWWRVTSTKNGTTLANKQADSLEISKAQFESKTNENENTISGDRINRSLIVTASIATVVTLTTLAILCIKRRSREKNELSRHDLDNFYHGLVSEEISETENYIRLPYDKERYEIEDSKISFVSGMKVLGAGEFGRVLPGKVNRDGNIIDVAIKTTNPETNHMYALKGLLSEIKLLAYIGKHANITELIGANTENLKSRKCWIILELCHLGSLQKYLREIRIPGNNLIVEYSNDYANCVEGYANIQMESNIEQLDMELSNDLYRWSMEICSAMAYLAEKHVVHADLATRNVLLDLRKVAKICDFGLSRRMYNYTDYVKTNQEPLPWKWMAPESLRFMQFSEKSDVWSFGITLWEIYSLGEVPYQGMSWDVNFAQMLERGLRLSEPKYNEHDKFELMKSCWKINADKRPTFSELYNLLTTN